LLATPLSETVRTALATTSVDIAVINNPCKHLVWRRVTYHQNQIGLSLCCAEFYTKHLTIQCGRHSFCSHALAGGRSLVEVKEAAGHANIATSSIYLHVLGDDDGTVKDLFDFGQTG
jgi:site-specific recombinase XerD